MSKGFSMTGWRIGYMAAPAWLVGACNKVQGQITSGASSFGQYASAIALTADLSPTRQMEAQFKKRRDIVIELLRAIPGLKVNEPKGAFYIFPDVSHYFGKSNGQITIEDSDQLAELLLTEAHVATVGGIAFGAPECIRLSYAASEDNIREAIRRIGQFFSQFV
jgi:aspartate aminotransferase